MATLETKTIPRRSTSIEVQRTMSMSDAKYQRSVDLWSGTSLKAQVKNLTKSSGLEQSTTIMISSITKMKVVIEIL